MPFLPRRKCADRGTNHFWIYDAEKPQSPSQSPLGGWKALFFVFYGRFRLLGKNPRKNNRSSRNNDYKSQCDTTFQYLGIENASLNTPITLIFSTDFYHMLDADGRPMHLDEIILMGLRQGWRCFLHFHQYTCRVPDYDARTGCVPWSRTVCRFKDVDKKMSPCPYFKCEFFVLTRQISNTFSFLSLSRRDKTQPPHCPSSTRKSGARAARRSFPG